MGLTQSQIETDLGRIRSGLASTDAVESVTLTPAGGSPGSPFNIIRATTLSEKELEGTGWAARYKLSIYDIDESASTAAVGDTITMSTEGALRILHIHRGPAIAYRRFDLGDKVSGAL